MACNLRQLGAFGRSPMLALASAAAALVLQDGRVAHVLKDDAAVARFIQSRVVELANAAIESKGAFSMSI